MAYKWSRSWWILQSSTAAFLCTLLVWGAALPIEKWHIDLDPNQRWVRVDAGHVDFMFLDSPDPLLLSRLNNELDWRPVWPNQRWNMLPWASPLMSKGFALAFPLWIPVVPTGFLASAAWWRHGPLRQRWQCGSCGYDLRGGGGRGRAGEAVRCPECGVQTTPGARSNCQVPAPMHAPDARSGAPQPPPRIH